MPYNTRRKSISLPSLGIHLPVTNAARAAAKTLSLALNTNNTTNTNTHAGDSTNSHRAGISTATITDTTGSSSAVDKDTDLETSSLHTSSSSSPTSSSFSLSSSITTASPASPTTPTSPTFTTPAAMPSKISPKRPAPDAAKAGAVKRIKLRNPSATGSTDQTPPSSPKRLASVENDANADCFAPVNMDGVIDDVVEAVVDLLQNNGNRPLLIKELETNLRLRLRSVQQSANPQAIICSRLSSFMKRPTWLKEKCPIAKELENTHPRRTYYYLTTCPNQPLPDPTSEHFILPRTMATPPISAASGPSAISESLATDHRREMSPSPEIDLDASFDFGIEVPRETPELELDDDFMSPATPNSFAYPRADDYRSHRSHQRGASPPLERDEREFTQTAEGLQKQKNAGNRFMLQPVGQDANTQSDLPTAGMRLTPEMQLFGHQSRQLTLPLYASASPFGASLDTSPDQRSPVSNALKNDELSELVARARFNAQAEIARNDESEPLTLDDLDLFFAQNPLE